MFAFSGCHVLLAVPTTFGFALAETPDISIVQGQVTGTDAGTRWSGGRRVRTHEECQIRAAYQIEGRRYDVEQVATVSTSREAAERCAEVSLGDAVTVYYLREDPSVASLDYDDFGDWTMVWIGGFCLVLGVASLVGHFVGALRASKPRRAEA